VLLLFGALGILVFAPVPICPTRNWLHVPCPGCGATRALLLALKGDLHGSLHMHPLAIPAALLLVPTLLVIARDMMPETTAGAEQPKPLPRPLRRAWTNFVALLFALWIARFFGAFGGPAPI